MSSFPEAFFASMVPFLRGTASSEQVVLELGASASGNHRLGYYRTLMQRNVSLILKSLYPTINTLSAERRPGLFAELVIAYDEQYPATYCEPNQFGRHFSEFLGRAASEFGFSHLWEDVADYEWARYAVGIAPTFVEPLGFHENEKPAGGEANFVVRQYDCDVIAVCKSLRNEAGVSLVLQERATSVVLYRDRDVKHSRAFVASPLQLLAIAKHINPETSLPAQLQGSDLLEQTSRALKERGLFEPIP